MPLDTQTLCNYRLERAEEDLATAKSNHEAGFYKAAINRAYYAIFHGIREKCDYSDFFVVAREDSAVQLENAETF